MTYNDNHFIFEIIHNTIEGIISSDTKITIKYRSVANINEISWCFKLFV